MYRYDQSGQQPGDNRSDHHVGPPEPPEAEQSAEAYAAEAELTGEAEGQDYVEAGHGPRSEDWADSTRQHNDLGKFLPWHLLAEGLSRSSVKAPLDLS